MICSPYAAAVFFGYDRGLIGTDKYNLAYIIMLVIYDLQSGLSISLPYDIKVGIIECAVPLSNKSEIQDTCDTTKGIMLKPQTAYTVSVTTDPVVCIRGITHERHITAFIVRK